MTTSHILTDRKVGTVFEQVAALHSASATKQYIEAALIAKLSERVVLPEPADFGWRDERGYWTEQLAYTEDQMREAFAQGAASQLSAEPCWYACKIEGAECDVTFFATKEEADDALYSDLADYPELAFEDLATPLYTRKEPT